MLRSRGYITISNASYKVQTDTSGLVYPSQKEGREKRKKEDKKNKASKNSWFPNWATLSPMAGRDCVEPTTTSFLRTLVGAL